MRLFFGYALDGQQPLTCLNESRNAHSPIAGFGTKRISRLGGIPACGKLADIVPGREISFAGTVNQMRRRAEVFG
jgi:hypothetical protein